MYKYVITTTSDILFESDILGIVHASNTDEAIEQFMPKHINVDQSFEYEYFDHRDGPKDGSDWDLEIWQISDDFSDCTFEHEAIEDIRDAERKLAVWLFTSDQLEYQSGFSNRILTISKVSGGEV